MPPSWAASAGRSPAVFAWVVDKLPLGAVMNKALRLSGAQQHGHRYIPEILDHMSRNEVKTEHLATHVMSSTRRPFRLIHTVLTRVQLSHDKGVGLPPP